MLAKHFFLVDSPRTASDYADYAAEHVIRDAQGYEAKFDQIIEAQRQAELRGDWDEARRLTLELEDFDREARDDMGGRNILAVYARMEDPLVVDAKGVHDISIGDTVERAKQEGHDGVIIKDLNDNPNPENNVPATHYAVFKNTQIKSATGNRGTFDAGNPNILYQEAKEHETFVKKATPQRHTNSLSDARKAAKQIVGKPITNEETGWVATVSNKTLKKMTSESAVSKSTSLNAHAEAVANVDQLFEHGVLGESKADRSGDRNINSIHRFFSPMIVDGRAVAVKLTVKELAVKSEQGNRIYSVEAIDIETPAGEFHREGGIEPTDAASQSKGRSVGPTGVPDIVANEIRKFNSQHPVAQTDTPAFKKWSGGKLPCEQTKHRILVINLPKNKMY